MWRGTQRRISSACLSENICVLSIKIQGIQLRLRLRYVFAPLRDIAFDMISTAQCILHITRQMVPPMSAGQCRLVVPPLSGPP